MSKSIISKDINFFSFWGGLVLGAGGWELGSWLLVFGRWFRKNQMPKRGN